MVEPAAIVVGWPASGVQTLLPTVHELGAVQLAVLGAWQVDEELCCTEPFWQVKTADPVGEPVVSTTDTLPPETMVVA